MDEDLKVSGSQKMERKLERKKEIVDRRKRRRESRKQRNGTACIGDT